MAKGKLCIDIGGTKIIFAIIDRPGHIIKSKRIDTPKSKDLFLKALSDNVKDYLEFSNGVINISIAGRVDNAGKVMFSPNLPILGFNFTEFMKSFSRKVTVENDGNCFGIYQLYTGGLKKYKSGLAIVWGTGIGSSIIYSGKIYKGGGFATESGHMVYDYNTGKDIENVIGGKSIKQSYGMNGFDLHKLAEKGDKNALKAFQEIGRTFGLYLSSMMLILDPEIIIIGGSFANSWKFMKDSVYSIIKGRRIRRKITVKISRGKFYVVKGCYFIDEYENSNNKL
ncbi:MAG: ROK family protein [Candidatus Parvarchaeota archaeon]|nr:ROK family protein [Candidatus Parvarchaeota archaeon]MCL5976115.1 ROK family protein [Candidatus Parvarchaeota archaeon]